MKGLLQVTALLSFYYRENPLLGKKIWESPQIAIFYRSQSPLPVHFPTTYSEKGRGIVFAAYQAMGTFNYPLVVCLHNYRSADRERNMFYKMDVISLLKQVSYMLPPEAAMMVLIVLKNRWYSYPSKKYDFESWYPIVRQLTTRIASCEETARSFKQQFPHLLVARAINRCNLAQYNRRRQALAWLRASNNKYRLVQDGFLKMGYATLEEKCEKNDGFNLVRQPTEKEKQLIAILERTVERVLPGYFGLDDLPPCRIILNEGGVWAGMATCTPIKNPNKNHLGISIKYVTICSDKI